MPNLRLTDINLAEPTAITPTTLIHIVTTADTSQNAAGSSYASTLGQVYDGLSGYCIPDLYVSNLHSCSPLYINPNNEGDINFGFSGSGYTLSLDVTNKKSTFKGNVVISGNTNVGTDKVLEVIGADGQGMRWETDNNLYYNRLVLNSQLSSVIDFRINNNSSSRVSRAGFSYDSNTGSYFQVDNSAVGGGIKFKIDAQTQVWGKTNSDITNISKFVFQSTGNEAGNLGISNNTDVDFVSPNPPPSAKIHIKGSDDSSSNYGLKVESSGGTANLYVRNDGVISTINLSGGTVSLKNNFETDIYNSYLSITLPNNTNKMYFSEVGFGHWNYGSSNPNISPWDSQTLLHKNRGFEVVNYGGNSTFIRALGSSQLQQLCYDYNNNHIFLSTDFFHTKAVTGGATFFQVDQSGAGSGIVKVGIGPIPLSGATSTLDVTGATGYNQFRMRTSYMPTSNADTNGNVGDVAWNDDFLYLKTNGGWGRIALDFVF